MRALAIDQTFSVTRGTEVVNLLIKPTVTVDLQAKVGDSWVTVKSITPSAEESLYTIELARGTTMRITGGAGTFGISAGDNVTVS